VPIATKIPEEETNDDDGDDETLLDMEMDEVQQFILIQNRHVQCDQMGGN